jgi:hypothetical protein
VQFTHHSDLVVVWTSEMLVKLYQSTQCYNPEDSHLHTAIPFSNITRCKDAPRHSLLFGVEVMFALFMSSSACMNTVRERSV